jgi:hypothetical protein
MDRYPAYRKIGGEWESLARDDQTLFLNSHRGHPLEELRIIDGPSVSYEDYVEPMRTSYFEARSGKRRFVVKRFRKSILEPCRYEAIEGKLLLTPGAPIIDAVSIEKELKRVFSPKKIKSYKIKGFVEELEKNVSRLTAEDLVKASVETHNPSIWYFLLNEKILEQTLAASSRFLSRRDRQLLAEFARENLADPLFMATARIDFQIEPKAGVREPGFGDSDLGDLINGGSVSGASSR